MRCPLSHLHYTTRIIRCASRHGRLQNCNSPDARAALERAQPEHARQLAAAQLDLTVAQANLAKARAFAPAGGTPDAVTIAQHRLEQAKNTLWGAPSSRWRG